MAALRTLLNHQVDGLLRRDRGVGRSEFDEIVGRAERPCVFFDSIVAGAGAGA